MSSVFWGHYMNSQSHCLISLDPIHIREAQCDMRVHNNKSLCLSNFEIKAFSINYWQDAVNTDIYAANVLFVFTLSSFKVLKQFISTLSRSKF